MSAVRAVGVDPGTLSFDVCGLDGDRVFLDRTFPTAEVGARPEVMVEAIRAAGPVDLVVGPSGYGLPWVAAADAGSRELALMKLSDDEQTSGTIIAGMRRMLGVLAGSGLPVCFAPAVVHLCTVPAHRKVNRVDMGTADKLCAVALGVWDQARRLGVPFDATSFEYLELGGAFTAVLAVRDGAVVDGAGGSSGPLGYLSAGALDGELAYLLGDFPKRSLASGGVAWVAGRPEEPPDVLAGAQDRRTATAWEAFFESVVKTVAGQAAVLGRPREILLSGRLGRVPWVAGEVTRRLGDVAPVRRVEGFAEKVKEAAQGAALIAQGLLGGESASLVEAMGIRAARGTVLDNLYVDGADEVRRSYRSVESDPRPLWERR